MPFFIAIRIYGDLPSSHSKQNVIRSAAIARFHGADGYHNYFKAIMTVFNDFAARRNNIAHGNVTNRDSGYYLTPPFHIGKNFDYIAREEKYAFNSSDIERFAENFAHSVHRGHGSGVAFMLSLRTSDIARNTLNAISSAQSGLPSKATHSRIGSAPARIISRVTSISAVSGGDSGVPVPGSRILHEA